MIERATTIIETIEYLTIASICPDQTPWNSPVYTAYDDDLNFYWASWVENQHSINIKNNKHVFCVIYDSRSPAGTGEGVYFNGQAESINEKSEISRATDLLTLRAGSSAGKVSKFINGDPRKIFKFVPEACWMNDGTTKNNDYIDIRVKLDLVELKNNLRNSETPC